MSGVEAILSEIRDELRLLRQYAERDACSLAVETGRQMARIVNDPEALKAWNKSQLAAAKAERRAGRV